MLAQIGGEYDPIDYELVAHYVEDSEADIHDGVLLDLGELLEEEETLGETLVVLAEHVVGYYYQQVPQKYVHRHLRRVEGALRGLDTHNQQ